MKGIFFVAAALLLFPVGAFAQNNSGTHYFDSPGFIAAGASALNAYGKTRTDSDVQPFITGMWSVFRTEYGSFGLSVSGIFATPYGEYASTRVSYKISSQQYIGDFSLNYIKNIKRLNFWLGIGLNLNYLESQMSSVKNNVTGSKANYKKNFSQTVYGHQYQIGLDYILTKDGSWGAFALFRGQNTGKAEFNIDRRLVRYSDGMRRYIRRDYRTMDLSNDLYTVGIVYHF